MSNASNVEDAPQPPKVLATPLEVAANLRMLQESHDPLIITFHERALRCQSFLVEVDRDNLRIVLDEMIPREGEKYLEAGEGFKVEGFHDGVRVAWESHGNWTITQKQGSRCYVGALPSQVVYHQRRNAFRAALKLSQLVDVEIAGSRLKSTLVGKLLDISAHGCKLRFEGDIAERLQLGQIYERFSAGLPFGAMNTAVELRHLHFEERIDTTFVGVRFHNIPGLMQRQLERFVHQLQRDAQRFDRDDF
ncbi:flagellar brake protein [Pseudomonas sp. CFBP 13719]|uniref:flagellar brake protein n=1 Tax=Pseudomonas sp. CFBP 13719 TaxID=2775303 RepID=UPI00177FC838|nr:flagellar brake protein [Pseudomonas sp. CFBP 13719]